MSGRVAWRQDAIIQGPNSVIGSYLRRGRRGAADSTCRRWRASTRTVCTLAFIRNTCGFKNNREINFEKLQSSSQKTLIAEKKLLFKPEKVATVRTVCQDDLNLKNFQKFGNRMWRGCLTTSKKLFLGNPSEICEGRWFLKCSNFPNNIGKSDFSKVREMRFPATQMAKRRSEGDDVAIQLI